MTDPGTGWACDAYGPDPEVRAAGALCFFAGTGKRTCLSLAECREKMTAERQRVWQRIQDGAAGGEPDMVYLAGEFSGPEQLLGGGSRMMAETAPDPLICLTCDLLNPPPDQSCKDGRDHFVGTGRGCPWCGRLLEACRERPCTPEAGDG